MSQNKDPKRRKGNGYLLLAGGGEFGGGMRTPDLRALELAGGAKSRISIIPAAAAPDNNHRKAGDKGVAWFRELGAGKVERLALIDRDSADDPGVIAGIKRSSLIYLLGGFPRHLEKSLAGSSSWDALLESYRKGSVVAGSSAGAMVLCGHYFNPASRRVLDGLNLLPGTCFLPHYRQFARHWLPKLMSLMPAVLLVGVDEKTAMLNDGPRGHWRVYGTGTVTIHRPQGPIIYHSGDTFQLPQPMVHSGSRDQNETKRW